jgi:aspartate racemase
MMLDDKIIGVVAGVGPFAGADLLHKIARQTLATKDQDHLTVASLSSPSQIADRTEYLLGQAELNPAYAIVEQLTQLEKMGASVAGIACNTAHAAQIFNVILDRLRALSSKIKLVHMIEEVARHLCEYHPQTRRLGTLCTTGTYRSRIYPNALEPRGFTVLLPNPILQEQVIHPAIYDAHYGIKACGGATEAARTALLEGVEHLRKKGAEAIVLGCAEISVAIGAKDVDDVPVIDPTVVMARALIREASPEKLKPLISEVNLPPRKAGRCAGKNADD